MIDILMATYNGERYIQKQIDSILNQSYKEWNLYIRDDGSKDSTTNIIKSYVERFPNKIFLVDDKNKNLGAKDNFFKLIETSKSDYIFFCDQDDIWLKGKLEKTLNLMLKLENEKGKDAPLLVHTNVKLITENEEIISGSFWDYSKINGKEKRFNRILVQNNITGCTMCINKKLASMAVKYNKDIIMHDWWLGLIAASFGAIDYIYEPTMLYRQHSKNEVGAKNYSTLKYKLTMLTSTMKMKNSILLTINQAKIFVETFRESLDRENLSIVENYANISSKGKFQRIMIVLNKGFLKYGIVRNIAYCILI